MPKKMGYKAPKKPMKGYARSEAAGTRKGESAYVERRKVGKGPSTPR